MGQGAGKTSVEQSLQLIEDRQAIEQLMMGDYPLALDSRNWKAYAALFTRDGELVQGSTVTKGPAAIEELFSRPRPRRTPPAGTSSEDAAPAGPPITKHVVTNLSLQIDGDRATAKAYWQTISTRGTNTVVAAAGHYEDILKRENGQWKFLRREIVNPARAAAEAQAASQPAQ